MFLTWDQRGAPFTAFWNQGYFQIFEISKQYFCKYLASKIKKKHIRLPFSARTSHRFVILQWSTSSSQLLSLLSKKKTVQINRNLSNWNIHVLKFRLWRFNSLFGWNSSKFEKDPFCWILHYFCWTQYIPFGCASDDVWLCVFSEYLQARQETLAESEERLSVWR